MHELSLAQGLIDQLLTLCQKHQATKVTEVTVVIGPFSGIVASSFSFGFEALKQEQKQTEESILIIETPDPEFTCLQCGKIFSNQAHHAPIASAFAARASCPHCSSDHCSSTGGDELILKQLEME